VLNEVQRDRLTDLLLNAVDAGDRREFYRYCKLAARQPTPRLASEARSPRRASVSLAVADAPYFTIVKLNEAGAERAPVSLTASMLSL
jgi:hypothetical protein